jgi:hypothetical protein
MTPPWAATPAIMAAGLQAVLLLVRLPLAAAVPGVSLGSFGPGNIKRPFVQKLGTVDVAACETTPVVINGVSAATHQAAA